MSEEFVLVDTSFLVALLDVQDRLHQRAEEIEKELAFLKLIFTDVLYRETLSVLSRRIKERRKGVELNFNDALLIVGAKEYGIERILSFDSDFDKFLKRIF